MIKFGGDIETNVERWWCVIVGIECGGIVEANEIVAQDGDHLNVNVLCYYLHHREIWRTEGRNTVTWYNWRTRPASLQNSLLITCQGEGRGCWGCGSAAKANYSHSNDSISISEQKKGYGALVIQPPWYYVAVTTIAICPVPYKPTHTYSNIVACYRSAWSLLSYAFMFADIYWFCGRVRFVNVARTFSVRCSTLHAPRSPRKWNMDTRFDSSLWIYSCTTSIHSPLHSIQYTSILITNSANCRNLL